MSIHGIATYHGMKNSDFFTEIYTSDVIDAILHSQFAQHDFDRFTYERYKDWYYRTQTKLGKMIK